MQFVGAGDFAPGPTVLPQSPADYHNPLGPKHLNQAPVEVVPPPGMPQGMPYAPMSMYQQYGGQPNGQGFHPSGYYPMMYYPGGGGVQWPGGYMPQAYMPIDNSTYYAVDQHGNYILLPQNMPNPQLAPEVGGNVPPHLNGRTDLPPGDNSPPMVAGDTELDGKQTGVNFDDSRGRHNIANTSLHRKNQAQKFRPNAVYKTLMCSMFEEHGRCTYGMHCQYAHGPEELRPNIPHPKYKTQMCNKFSTPHGCQYGDKCHFRHPDDPAPTFTQSHIQSRSGATFFESNPAPLPPKPSIRRNKQSQCHATPPTLSKSSQNNLKKAATPVTSAKNFAASSDPAVTDTQTKEKECLIKLSMYHHFENYIGKNRKPATLARSNSCSTVGNFTFVRFISMQKLVNEQVSRLRSKKSSVAIGKKDSLTTPQTPMTADPSGRFGFSDK